MALTGTLRDFGIAEILQLIGTQKKTGVLTVEDGKRHAQIEFADGMVVGAHGGEETVSLQERFVRSGMLSWEQMDAAQKRSQETLKPLTAVLVSDGYISPETLREVITRHNSEIVYEVFDWKSGTYAFQQKFLQWDKQLVAPIPAESIMMEGLRISDEGPGVRKLIPSLDDIYSPVERSPAELEQLDPDTRQLYELVDGRKPLMDVIIASHQPKFDAMRHLAWLRMNRFILKEKRPESETVEPAPRKAPQHLTVVTKVALYVLLAVAAAAAVIKFGQSVWRFAAPVAHIEESGVRGSSLLKAREERVRAALDVYYLRHGRYPDRLETLLQDKLAHTGDIKPRGLPPIPYMALDAGSKYLLSDAAKSALAAGGVSER